MGGIFESNLVRIPPWPDLADYATLSKVQASTLLIGGNDEPVIEMNKAALPRWEWIKSIAPIS